MLYAFHTFTNLDCVKLNRSKAYFVQSFSADIADIISWLSSTLYYQTCHLPDYAKRCYQLTSNALKNVIQICFTSSNYFAWFTSWSKICKNKKIVIAKKYNILQTMKTKFWCYDILTFIVNVSYKQHTQDLSVRNDKL